MRVGGGWVSLAAFIEQYQGAEERVDSVNIEVERTLSIGSGGVDSLGRLPANLNSTVMSCGDLPSAIPNRFDYLETREVPPNP